MGRLTLTLVGGFEGRLDGSQPLRLAAPQGLGAPRLKATQQAFPCLWLGEAQLLAGRLAEADERPRQALVLAEARREHGHEAHALRLQAEIAALREPADAALTERLYRRAIAEELAMRPLIARCRLGLGLLYARTGQRESARAELAAARRLLSGMATDSWQARVEAALHGFP
jgi:hypothetical protein